VKTTDTDVRFTIEIDMDGHPFELKHRWVFEYGGKEHDLRSVDMFVHFVTARFDGGPFDTGEASVIGYKRLSSGLPGTRRVRESGIELDLLPDHVRAYLRNAYELMLEKLAAAQRAKVGT
jgi:hypothetical protein